MTEFSHSSVVLWIDMEVPEIAKDLAEPAAEGNGSLC